MRAIISLVVRAGRPGELVAVYRSSVHRLPLLTASHCLHAHTPGLCLPVCVCCVTGLRRFTDPCFRLPDKPNQFSYLPLTLCKVAASALSPSPFTFLCDAITSPPPWYFCFCDMTMMVHRGTCNFGEWIYG